ncbi:MAG: glycosyltransferase family 4 protein [Nitrospirota bacterium]
MRILIVSMSFPLPPKSGGRLRVFNLLKHLASRHRVTLLTLADSAEDVATHIPDLERLGARVIVVPWRPGPGALAGRVIRNAAWLGVLPLSVLNKRSPALAKALHELLQRESFDVVQIEWIQMAQHVHDSDWPLLARRGVLVEHDVAWLPLQRRVAVARGIGRWFWAREARLMRAYEEAVWRRFAAVVTMSDQDAQHVRPVTDRVNVVPNGVDVAHYAECVEAKRDDRTLLFVGWFRHDPNVDALRYFLESIYPRLAERHPDVTLRVVGSHLPRAVERLASRRPSVELSGYVEDVRPVLARAAVSVVPLRVGGGTRLKILESMAAGTPVVTTSIGCEGLDVEAGRHLLVEDSPEGFAGCVSDLLTDEGARRRLAREARSLVESQYDWSRSAQELERVYEAVSGSG